MKWWLDKYRLLILLMLFSLNSLAQGVFEPPTLRCVRNSNSDVVLSWLIPTNRPCFQQYEIYYSINNRSGSYSLLTTISNQFQSTITIPNPGNITQDVYFYIIQRGSCANPTPPTPSTSDTLDDIKPQPAIVLKDITVVSGQMQVNWYGSTNPEVIGYLVFNSLDGFTTPDTIYGRTNISYTDASIDVNKDTVKYRIRTLEYCEDPLGYQGALTDKDHRSCLLNINTPDPCTKSVSVNWTPYLYEDGLPTNYEIQTKFGSGAYTSVGTVANNATSYIIQNIPAQTTVCARVKINLPNGFTAYSNERCINSDVIESYEDDYIRAITINQDNHIVIHYIKDTSASTPKKFVLQRSPDNITFTPVTITPFLVDSTQIIFVDGAANPSNNVFYYRVVTTDACNAEHYSQVANTIHLTIEEDNGNTANIEWNDFYTDSAQILSYNVYTYQDSILTLFGSYGNGIEQATYDDLFDYTADSITEVCFMIIAEYYNLNDNTPRLLLRNSSNIVCLKPTPKLFMPNAIAPQGINRSIKPILFLASDNGYSFKVFNRWHQMVFSTNNRDEAWFGDYNGTPAPVDAYLYFIEYQGVDGQRYTATGTINLIR